MKSLSLLPRNITACMSDADKRALSHDGKTPKESLTAAAARDEREIQKQISNYLRLLCVPFNQDAMHRKRTGTVGWPDFVFPYKGFAVFFECKCPWSRTLRPEQEQVRESIIKQGGVWRLITSLAEAQTCLRELDNLAAKK